MLYRANVLIKAVTRIETIVAIVVFQGPRRLFSVVKVVSIYLNELLVIPIVPLVVKLVLLLLLLLLVPVEGISFLFRDVGVTAPYLEGP